MLDAKISLDSTVEITALGGMPVFFPAIGHPDNWATSGSARW